MKIRALVAAAAVTGSLAAALPAHAATWKGVTATDGSSIDQVGVARTSDGTLHLAWHDPTGPNSADLLHTTIGANGTIGATNPITTGWTGFSDPGLVATPAGLQVFFGAIRTTEPGEPNQELNFASSTDGGATWNLQIGSIVPGGAQAYASDVSATALPDGTPLQAWAGTLGTWVHAGLDPATPNHDFQAPLGQYGYNPGIATDASGQTVMAWFSSATGHLGVQAQSVAPDGSPVGSATTMPGTEAMVSAAAGRTPIVARAEGGFYVAYTAGQPAANRVRVWRVGGASSTVLARTSGQGNQPTTVAADAEGRIWVAWVQNVDGGPRVFARRSNPDGTRFGETVEAGRPRDTQSGYALDASVAPGGGLDLLGVFNIGTTANAATFHARILPALTIDVSAGRLVSGESTRIRITVTDAGEPVKGAKVTIGGVSGRTNSKGKVTLRIKPKRRNTAKATLTGYTSATELLRARR